MQMAVAESAWLPDYARCQPRGYFMPFLPKPLSVPCLLLSACLLSTAAAPAEWQAKEQVQPYAISGRTAAELYFSIGENGPKAGIGRAIAYTDFKLTWQRDYRPRDGGCTLVTARPNLTVIYTLPRPKGALPAGLQANWDRFAAGIAAHEKVHGDFIKDMVREIEAATVGLHEAADPGCTRIRATLKRLLSDISQRQRQRSREFDRKELSEGGNVHQLVLSFVNAR
jgi:predicted secreted Zn-dependent protease